ncbi:MAG TPA: hypothetical protein VHG08_15720 [Longimicrobium sp.]|nr:hypothetical protein [Longimicrobium sp.]
MDDALKQSILQNRFVERLRLEFVVDMEAYEQLCGALRALAETWRGARMIDREVAQDLYVLAPITQSMAARMREMGLSRADGVEEMAIEIDALVLGCLSGGGAGGTPESNLRK